jgi:hypothetical protein
MRLRGRIERLEHREEASQQGGVQLVVERVDMPLALDSDRCVEILRESGFGHPGPGMSVIRLTAIPEGLNARQLESYLRQHAAEICRPGKEK